MRRLAYLGALVLTVGAGALFVGGVVDLLNQLGGLAHLLGQLRHGHDLRDLSVCA